MRRKLYDWAPFRRHRLNVHRLEERTVPATFYAIDDSGMQLIRFNSASPGVITATINVSGLSSSETLQGIDFRPATGQLFGLSVGGGLASIGSINPVSGTFTRIGTPFNVAGADFGFDFNPTNDRIRVTSDADVNLLLNPNDGSVTIQGNLNPGNPNIVASAYTNNFANATITTLFGVDSSNDQLFQQVPATGTLTPIGNLGIDIDGSTGFDITQNNNAFLAVFNKGMSELHSINLNTGATTFIGAIGSASATTNVRGLAVARFVWDGGGSTPNWTDPINWVGDLAPEAGDDLVFPAGATQMATSNNNFPVGTAFNSIVLTSNGYTIGGNGITLNAGITDSSSIGLNSLNFGINLAGTQIVSVYSPGVTLALGGPITGGAGASLNKEKVGATTNNGGTLRFNGAVANTYLGTTTVNGGVLELAMTGGVPGVGGPLLIGDNTGGAGADVVRELTSNNVADGANVSVNSSGVFDLNNQADVIGNLLSAGGTVLIGTGKLTSINPTLDNSSTLVLSIVDANASGRVFGLGTITVGGALQLNAFATIPTGAAIILIDNDGTADPVVGNFNGLAEGSQVSINGQNFTITYRGGDGNDVALVVSNTASGILFEDHNGNGIQDSSDQGLAGATIFEDVNGNDALDAGESSTVSDANGNWTLTFNSDGVKTIRQIPPGGFVQTTPNPTPFDISGGQNATGFSFGDFKTITISGTVFNDLNKNGARDPGEPGQVNVAVQIDVNADGINDANAFTDANGNYGFSNLGPGIYRLTQIPPFNFVQTTPNPANITSDSGVNVGGINFGNAVDRVNLFAVGAGVGCGPRVYVYNSDNSIRFQFMAYDVSFNGDVRVATGDVNGDGFDDIITGAGPSGGPHVKVFNGIDRSLLFSFFAYDASFTGGLYVAAGDVNGDGNDDIITGADAGGGPHVKVFDGTNLNVLRSFFAYSPAFMGGVRVAAGDINNDNRDDIITGAGPGGGPHVCVYDGASNALIRSFYAYAPSFTGGVYVGAMDLNCDGRSDIVTGAGAGGGPHVQIYNGINLAVLQSFYAYASSFTGGVRVASGDLNNDGRDDLITGPGPGMISLIREFRNEDLSLIAEFDAFGPMFLGGAYVG